MQNIEPPSCGVEQNIVLIGKDGLNRWVAREQNGRFGGLFVSRAHAIKFALSELGRSPHAIIDISQPSILDVFTSSGAASTATQLAA
ncbi:hypothetical protein [Rhodopseudomonas palustris]|uniref:hypothetical protein n=1 Tax=Rhodopseudomonas palustris TaxID=1076 RepID=UPI000CECAD23|nr:hypothetical protein [Rhodopseudomonas palustris]PPQ45298.1 hypothetical protein CKO39_00955 [Rhodopseudomonas palustris]